MGTIRVELGERSYPIVIERGILPTIGARLKERGFSGRTAVVTNPTVGGLYGEVVLRSLKEAGFNTTIIMIPDGEEFKTLKEASHIYDGLITHRMERNSPIVALGGGVIGDVTGFAAATYLRGVPYIQVPTTLLSQVDSSVGGKTSVNHPRGKNLIGAFYQPGAVFIDPEVLNTLDVREVRAGFAEVVKYGVIWDEEFFRFLEENVERLLKLEDEIIRAITKSCEIKAKVVEEDEREKGLRSILNFGHTFGHAIETVTEYSTFKHGEAVSIGMNLATLLSARLGFCGEEAVKRIRGLLASFGLPVNPPPVPAESLVNIMRLDKKVAGERMRFVLVSEVGSIFLKDVSEEEVFDFFEFLGEEL